jgi:ferredoxin
VTTVSVDRELCVGHGHWFTFAPDVYEPDDDGFCRVRVTVIRGELAVQATEGAEACPESAIAVQD